MTEPTPPDDNHDEHESHAGEPVPDPWDEPQPGTRQEYDRLVAERGRLIGEGVPPDQLVEPLRPRSGDSDG